ncbi:hypothetical protein LguiA_030146 [Lonicera macranthoides]
METNTSMLPEGCISEILSLTSPWDACRSSAVSPVFKSAADSDAFWERFLPSDYLSILARSVSPVVYTTRKQLYFLLSDSPILLDGGELSFMLDKRSGKKCYMLPSTELSIAWMNDARYWKWPSIRESRFSEVAQLIIVCWLEIRGYIRSRMLSPMTTYAAYLVYKISQRINYGLDCLANTLVRFIGDGVESDTFVVFLKEPVERLIPRGSTYRLPRRREDRWMEIELGSFFNGRGDDNGEVMMELMEIELGHNKCGLILEGIEVLPKEKVVNKDA